MATRGQFDPIAADGAETAARVRPGLVCGDSDVTVRPNGSLPALGVAPKLAKILHLMKWVVITSRVARSSHRTIQSRT